MCGYHRLSDIVGLWKSVAACGRAIGIKPDTMRAYAAGRRSFPVEKIDAFVAAARSRPGGEGVSHELVVRLAASARSGGEDAGNRKAA